MISSHGCGSLGGQVTTFLVQNIWEILSLCKLVTNKNMHVRNGVDKYKNKIFIKNPSKNVQIISYLFDKGCTHTTTKFEIWKTIAYIWVGYGQKDHIDPVNKDEDKLPPPAKLTLTLKSHIYLIHWMRNLVAKP